MENPENISETPASLKQGLDRRVALQKLALHGAVTTPMMLAVLTSEKAAWASGGGGGGCGFPCNDLESGSDDLTPDANRRSWSKYD